MEGTGGAWCATGVLAFQLRDPERRLAGVRLLQHVGLPTDGLAFRYDERDRAWRLGVPHPALWRLEYQLELHHPDGRTEVVCHPENGHRVDGGFGAKSVLECPEYRAPGWLRLPAATGVWRELAVATPGLKATMSARIWSPPAATSRVVVAHDGPEYDRLGSLGHYTAAMVAAGRVPPHHLVLVDPGDRDEWYSANRGYARALVADVLPRVLVALGARPPVVGLGASLGALAMLHAQRSYPRAFAGLFLQSGSFFRPRYDGQEAGFHRYPRIVRFVGRVHRGADRATRDPAVPIPAVLTCGRVEENLRNNRDMAATLRQQGYRAILAEVPDAHNFTGWRDAFDPYLTDLLTTVWTRERVSG